MERYNRTQKNMLGIRMVVKGIPKNEWTSEVRQVIRKCNNSHRKAINATPNMADKDPAETKLNIESNANVTRKYPALK